MSAGDFMGVSSVFAELPGRRRSSRSSPLQLVNPRPVQPIPPTEPSPQRTPGTEFVEEARAFGRTPEGAECRRGLKHLSHVRSIAKGFRGEQDGQLSYPLSYPHGHEDAVALGSNMGKHPFEPPSQILPAECLQVEFGRPAARSFAAK